MHELKAGDKVRVRFDLTKHNGMMEFAEESRKKGVEIPDSFPIGYADGVVLRKSFYAISAREKCPIAVVRFGRDAIICNLLNVSGDMAISIGEGPDSYGARIVDEHDIPYTEKIVMMW